MKCSKIATIPVNPRLQFGVRLSQICVDGTLHPGLRDLFLKAYLNTAEDTITEDDLFDNYIQKALSYGPEGHGSLDERLLLKDYLENGQFIISLKTPPGAPIWVIRHFLGRLPRPLLSEFIPCHANTKRESWLELANECRHAVKLATTQGHSLNSLKMNLATILIQLEKCNYLVLSALIGLIRNLGAGRSTTNARLNKRVIFTLVCYFSQALISRPFRPGLATDGDRRFYPLLLFLIYYWTDIRHIINKLNSTCVDECLTLGKPRMCDSLPTCISLETKTINKKYNKKTQSLEMGRLQPNHAAIASSSSSKSKDVQHESQHSDSQRHSQIESASESHPLIYKCCNCKAVNQVEAKIYLNVNNVPQKTVDAVTQCAQIDEPHRQNDKSEYQNISSWGKAKCGNDQNVTSLVSNACPCNVKNFINFNANDLYEQHNMEFGVSSDDKNSSEDSVHEIPKNNFNTVMNRKSQDKIIDWDEDLGMNTVQHLDTLSEEDADVSSDNTTSDYSSEGSTKKLLKNLNVTRLRNKLKLFSARNSATHKSFSDDFMVYSKVKYKKICNSAKNVCSNL